MDGGVGERQGEGQREWSRGGWDGRAVEWMEEWEKGKGRGRGNGVEEEGMEEQLNGWRSGRKARGGPEGME